MAVDNYLKCFELHIPYSAFCSQVNCKKSENQNMIITYAIYISQSLKILITRKIVILSAFQTILRINYFLQTIIDT